MNNKFLTGQAVILAAGESSRFWPLNYRHKSLIKIMGRSLIWYTINDLKKAGVKEAIIVQGIKKDIEIELKNEKFKNLKIKYAIQEEPTGTGGAVLAAKNLIKGPFFVLNAERVDAKECLKLFSQKINDKKEINLLVCPTSTPWLFGVVRLDNDRIIELVEKPEKGKEPSNFKVPGIYFFPREFLSYLEKVPSHPYSLWNAFNLWLKEKEARAVFASQEENIHLKYPWDTFDIARYLMNNYLKGKIGENVSIAKSAIVEKGVYIGDNTKVFERAIIKAPGYIGNNCIIGNNALLRENCDLEDEALVGSFAELKNTIFQKDVHVHSGYFGDTIFGENCRTGSGTVIGNVRLDRENVKSVVKGERIDTGLRKLGAIIGNGARIGINASFMPGVLVGSNCAIGPASLVRENIEDNTKFYSKFEGVFKKQE